MTLNILQEDNANVIQFTNPVVGDRELTELKDSVMSAVAANKSVIISFENTAQIAPEIYDFLRAQHEEFYNAYQLSFVVCCIQANLVSPAIEELNITPTLIEAIDIVNMEVIERELLG